MDYKYLISLAITVGGWCVMFGVYKQKINKHDEEIKELRSQLNSVNNAFDSIKDGLTNLNTKMDLLLNGKLVIPNNKEVK